MIKTTTMERYHSRMHANNERGAGMLSALVLLALAGAMTFAADDMIAAVAGQGQHAAAVLAQATEADPSEDTSSAASECNPDGTTEGCYYGAATQCRNGEQFSVEHTSATAVRFKFLGSEPGPVDAPRNCTVAMCPPGVVWRGDIRSGTAPEENKNCLLLSVPPSGAIGDTVQETLQNQKQNRDRLQVAARNLAAVNFGSSINTTTSDQYAGLLREYEEAKEVALATGSVSADTALEIEKIALQDEMNLPLEPVSSAEDAGARINSLLNPPPPGTIDETTVSRLTPSQEEFGDDGSYESAVPEPSQSQEEFGDDNSEDFLRDSTQFEMPQTTFGEQMDEDDSAFRVSTEDFSSERTIADIRKDLSDCGWTFGASCGNGRSASELLREYREKVATLSAADLERERAAVENGLDACGFGGIGCSLWPPSNTTNDNHKMMQELLRREQGSGNQSVATGSVSAGQTNAGATSNSTAETNSDAVDTNVARYDAAYQTWHECFTACGFQAGAVIEAAETLNYEQARAAQERYLRDYPNDCVFTCGPIENAINKRIGETMDQKQADQNVTGSTYRAPYQGNPEDAGEDLGSAPSGTPNENQETPTSPSLPTPLPPMPPYNNLVPPQQQQPEFFEQLLRQGGGLLGPLLGGFAQLGQQQARQDAMNRAACAQYPGTTLVNGRCACPGGQSFTNGRCMSGAPGENEGGSVVDNIQPTAELSCAPETAEVGSPIALSWSCRNATASRGDGFDTGTRTSGSAQTTATTTESGSMEFALTCIRQGRTVTDICSVAVNKSIISLVANPNPVATGSAAGIGWITTGMESCTIQALGESTAAQTFNETYADIEKTNGVAETPALSGDLTVELSCLTVGGEAEEASVTVEVQ